MGTHQRGRRGEISEDRTRSPESGHAGTDIPAFSLRGWSERVTVCVESGGWVLRVAGLSGGGVGGGLGVESGRAKWGTELNNRGKKKKILKYPGL